VHDCTRLGSTVRDWARLCIHWATTGPPLGKLLGTYCVSTGRYCVALASTVRLLCTLWGLLHCEFRGPFWTLTAPTRSRVHLEHRYRQFDVTTHCSLAILLGLEREILPSRINRFPIALRI
jgi:hypothetical protein